MVGSISSWNALEAWQADMSNRVNAIVAEDEMEQRESLLQKASMALSRYERMESTALLELSLWDMELNSADVLAPVENAARTAVDKDDREPYRIRSGASVVIPNVIAFFTKLI
jgi:cell division septal protein FtsQ